MGCGRSSDNLKAATRGIDCNEDAAIWVRHRRLHRYRLTSSSLKVANVEAEVESGLLLGNVEGAIKIGALARREGFTSWH
jgi:hypothetical protein